MKKQRHHFASKGPSSQGYGFSSGHVWRWELNHKEGWVPKNWCFGIVMLKTLESPLNTKEIKPVNPKGNQPRIFIGRTMLKLSYFGHLMWRADSLEKTLMLGNTEGKRRGHQRMRWLDGITNPGYELEQTPGDNEGQGSLMCCRPWGRKEYDIT